MMISLSLAREPAPSVARCGPGRYATEDPDRYAVLEPGRPYAIAVQSGSTAGATGAAGTGAWTWYAEPVRRGVAGEREHRREAAQGRSAGSPPELF
ncbi:hypothetical protein ACIQK6_01705 [Streptomyces sp. NPDC091682]|uniref:hypothetical protein n=1 Tax=Streptomyces sp. NPDC091682 TaxID=3366005 RepID=UPI0037F39279